MKLLKRILKKEAGQALPMALILLVLGGFLVVPTLAFMTTNLTANRQIDRKNLELYAADAGVEDALWNIKYGTEPEGGWAGWSHQFELNDREVNVSISKPSGQPYLITSIASADGHSTTIECFVDAETPTLYGAVAGCKQVKLGPNTFLTLTSVPTGGVNFPTQYSWFFNSAITSKKDVTIKPDTVVTGDVVYGDDLTNNGTINGDIIRDPSLADNWPLADYLSDYYYEQVATAPTVPDDYTIDINGYTQANPCSIGPLSALGDLEIKGKGWARLDGTLYVNGVLTVKPECTIDLNGQTIFVKDSIVLQPECAIKGSGCIIAVK